MIKWPVAVNFRFLRLFSSPSLSSNNSSIPNLAINSKEITKIKPILRTGALGIKKGMMSYWDTWGKRHPVTILHLDHVQALDTFKCGSNLIQNIGISHRSPYQTHPAQLKYFNNCGTAPKLKVHGFKISEGAEVGKGEFIYAAHFLPGQFVDVIGKSIGKGFQGAMKRWGFHGQPASHGVSLSHRSIGATSGRSDPGRVFKGKKMAGRMGGDQVTVRKLRIMRVDTALNCLWVRGAIPGHDNSIIRILDSKCPENRAIFEKNPPPMPTLTLATVKTLKLPRELDSTPISSKDPLKIE